MIGRYRNALLFVTLACLFGVSFVAIKTGLAELPPLLFAAFRFDVAAPPLLAYAAWRYDEWVPRTRADLLAVVVGAVALIALNNGFLFLGQRTTTPAAASVMYGLNPILAPVVAVVVLNQRLDARGVIGVLLGLVGVLIIVQPSPASLMAGSTVGQLFVLAAAASVAVGSVLLRRVANPLASVPTTAWAMAVGAGVLHLASLATGEPVVTTATAPVMGAVLVVGVVSTAFAYPIYFGLIRTIGPVRANLVAYLVPVVAAVTGWLLLGEPVTLATGLGFLVVLAGVALLERDVIVAELGRLRGRPPVSADD